jgi:hypothetical protein
LDFWFEIYVPSGNPGVTRLVDFFL